ncbi:hypothetical protein LIER_37041 [Lithospermum erythrorhizon]|uniref:Uncharacterized protein n=1 Tax=Lithospermum erythrorhizon TaxID=34254 RepID=A0AAV3PIX7_LITER
MMLLGHLTARSDVYSFGVSSVAATDTPSSSSCTHRMHHRLVSTVGPGSCRSPNPHYPPGGTAVRVR